MKLLLYSSPNPIFIDANVFLDYTLPNRDFGEAVSDFLEKIELQDIDAITAPIVPNEVSYNLLLQRGMVILDTENRDAVRRRIKENSWSEPLRVDKKLSNANSWRETYEEDEAALRSRLQDISTAELDAVKPLAQIASEYGIEQFEIAAHGPI